MNYEKLLSRRTGDMGPSAIREILKVVSQPGMVSLAGGIPSPESFPMDRIKELTNLVINKYGSAAFQYDLTEGFTPLRESLSGYLEKRGIIASAEDIIVQTGSQGVLDAIGMSLISEGDKIAVEAPTYLGAIQAFRPYQPSFIRVEMDEKGMIPESLEETLKKHQIKFVYTVPTFQNPTGRSISLERRKRIAEIITEHDALMIEDDPYSNLRYTGEALPAVKTFAPDNVIYITTLSKVLAPGLRIGVCVAPAEIRKWLIIVKQGIDLHTSTFSQALAAEYIASGYLDEQLPRIIELYRPRHAAMLNALGKYFPSWFRFSRPEGGMFIWAESDAHVDSEEIYRKAVKNNVAFVPGKYFYTQPGQGLATMRLNFTMAETDVITAAVKKLGEVISSFS